MAVKEKCQGKFMQVPVLLHDSTMVIYWTGFVLVREFKDVSSTIFSWPGTRRMPLISKFEKYHLEQIFNWWWTRSLQQNVSWRSSEKHSIWLSL